MEEKLSKYRQKRNFDRTAEPKGDGKNQNEGAARADSSAENAAIYSMQYHEARRAHFDLRLERRGVLLSWAMPKGPSTDVREKRLAVRVEDHPVEYASFEGTIPEGEYGGGTVMLWDEGGWKPLADIEEGLENGSLKFELDGARLKGKWALVKLKEKEGDKKNNWLLIKEKDGLDKASDVTAIFTRSVKSGRTIKEIADGAAAVDVKRNPSCEYSPQLAMLADSAPEGDEWLYEIKYDGYRIIAAAEGGRAKLSTRNGIDYTRKFRAVADDLAAWSNGRACVLDGEMIAAGEDGKADFAALQRCIKNPASHAATYIVFDVLALDGKDCRELPQVRRKEILATLLRDAPPSLRYSAHIVGGGQSVFEAACDMGLEGIVGKRTDAPYHGGKNGDWIKLKCYGRQEFVVCGYTLSLKRGQGIGALILGAYEDGKLTYTGRAGTGLGTDAQKSVKQAAAGLERKTSPFETPLKERKDEKIFWLEPKLTAEVQFAERTDKNVLRQASFKGLRYDKAAVDVTIERPSPPKSRTGEDGTESEKGKGRAMSETKAEDGRKKKDGTEKSARKGGEDFAESQETVSKTQNTSQESSVCGIKISNPDKVVYRSENIKKIDVAGYYAAVAQRMLPYVGGRILSVVRCHKGADGECFFKKHPAGESRNSRVVPVLDDKGNKSDYFCIDDERGLVEQAQSGTLEFHVWGSGVDSLERPDMMVFDLDPDVGMKLARIREGVRDLKSVLESLSLKPYLKTSGGKGYHVVVRFEPTENWQTFRDFARRVAEYMESEWPDKYTANIRKNKRGGKIFIDWARNTRGATSVSPYSLRARAGAKVSMPIEWAELDDVAPDGVDMYEALKRLEIEDPWKDFYGRASILE